MLNDRIELWSEQRDHRRRRHLWIYSTLPDGTRRLAEALVFKPEPEGVYDLPPTIAPDATQFLQAVLDHAWSIGMRPVGFSDTPLQVAALKYHLEDMRKLVFGHHREEKTVVDTLMATARLDREGE